MFLTQVITYAISNNKQLTLLIFKKAKTNDDTLPIGYHWQMLKSFQCLLKSFCTKYDIPCWIVISILYISWTHINFLDIFLGCHWTTGVLTGERRTHLSLGRWHTLLTRGVRRLGLPEWLGKPECHALLQYTVPEEKRNNT